MQERSVDVLAWPVHSFLVHRELLRLREYLMSDESTRMQGFSMISTPFVGTSTSLLEGRRR